MDNLILIGFWIQITLTNHVDTTVSDNNAAFYDGVCKIMIFAYLTLYSVDLEPNNPTTAPNWISSTGLTHQVDNAGVERSFKSMTVYTVIMNSHSSGCVPLCYISHCLFSGQTHQQFSFFGSGVV